MYGAIPYYVRAAEYNSELPETLHNIYPVHGFLKNMPPFVLALSSRPPESQPDAPSNDEDGGECEEVGLVILLRMYNFEHLCKKTG